ncbi:serine hydrolase [Microbacterium sp. NPDC055665]
MTTIKAFVAAAFLRSTTPQEREELVFWTQDDLDKAGYAPVTTEHLATGLTIGELAEASVRTSDNVATNLVMRHLGGPEAIMTELASIVDDVTDLRDEEPGLNFITPGNTANTTTSAAFASTMGAIVGGDCLRGDDLAIFIAWMSDNGTGDELIRAGAPAGWDIAEKSGGAGGVRNDVAIAYPPSGSSLIIVIFTTKPAANTPYENALVADVAAEVISALAG